MARLQLNSDTATHSISHQVRNLLPVYALYIAIAVASRLIEDLFQSAGLSPTAGRSDPSMLTIGLFALLTFAWTLFSSALALAYLARKTIDRPNTFSFLRTIELMMIESARAVAATLIRLPLLVLPGLFEWIRLSPIPFIILLDPAYQRGEKDALQSARIFFRRHRTFVFSLLLLTASLFLVEFAVTSTASDIVPLWQDPPQHVWSIFLFCAARLAIDVFTLHMYRKSMSNEA